MGWKTIKLFQGLPFKDKKGEQRQELLRIVKMRYESSWQHAHILKTGSSVGKASV